MAAPQTWRYDLQSGAPVRSPQHLDVSSSLILISLYHLHQQLRLIHCPCSGLSVLCNGVVIQPFCLQLCATLWLSSVRFFHVTGSPARLPTVPHCLTASLSGVPPWVFGAGDLVLTFGT